MAHGTPTDRSDSEIGGDRLPESLGTRSGMRSVFLGGPKLIRGRLRTFGHQGTKFPKTALVRS